MLEKGDKTRQAPYMPSTRKFVDEAHDYLGNSTNTDSIRQAKGEPLAPTPTLETNKLILETKYLISA